MQQKMDWKQVEHVHEICIMAPTQQLEEKARAILRKPGIADVDVFVTSNGRPGDHRLCQGPGGQGRRIIISAREPSRSWRSPRI